MDYFYAITVIFDLLNLKTALNPEIFFIFFFFLQVHEVRTNDDTTLQVQLMIFYHLKDIITMVTLTFP